MWGETLCAEAGWRWRCLKDKEECESYVVASPNASHVVDPIGVLHAIASSRGVANNSALLFNMIVAGDLPNSPKRGYCWLS